MYNDCDLKNRVCDVEYNVEESIVINSGQHSVYESCDPYDALGKYECVKIESKYKLVGCEE
ncbi:hypothetical protein IKI14_05530 [bacterium]|nr:hypothetical protein [bacterium]